MIGYILGALSLLICFIYCFYIRKRISNDILKQTRVFERILCTTPDTIFIVDHKFQILKQYDGNQESKLFTAAIGTNLQDILAKEDFECLSTDIKKAFSTESILKNEYILNKDGQKHHYIGRFACIDKQQVFCLLRNIDARKNTESIIYQNKIILDSVLDSMPFPVMLKDVNNDFKYIYWNKQCDLLSGFNRTEVLGKTDFEIYGPEKGKEFREIDEMILSSGKPYRQQEEFITRNGTLYDTIVEKNLISNSSNSWLLITRWDITDLIRIQTSLSLANSQLNLAFSAGNITPWMWDITNNMVYIGIEDFKHINGGFVLDRNGVSIEFVLDHIHPDDREKMIMYLTQLREKAIDKAHFEVRYDATLQFNNYYNIFSTVESFDKDGVAIRIIGSMQNITEQKNFEKELILANQQIKEVNRTNEIILDNTDVGLVYLTPDYIVQWENISKYSSHPMAANYRRGVCCYENIRNLKAPCPGCIMQASIASKKREIKEVEFSGGVTAQIMASPVWDETETCQGIVLKIKDITEDKRKATDLQTAKEKAENSDKLKSAFLANMSHEIRTPLNAILGFSELLSTTDDPQEKNNYLQIINSNNELLLQLINDILDLSKIEANTLEFVYTDVDINSVMNDLERSFRFKTNTLEIIFEKHLPECFINTDKNRLQQVMSNFMTNALKFTEKGRISFGYERRDTDIYFYVTDTGTGIPEEKQSDIFKRFTKLNNFKTGTGLGLTICQTIVHKLNGDIGVVSELGKGSTFWFTIPLVFPPKKKPILSVFEIPENTPEEITITPEIITPIDLVPVPDKPILLIAEDVIDNYRLYEALLSRKYHLLHAWNGLKAIALFKEHHPSAILMDIKMPEMDGYEATAAIRKLDAQIPIVAVTAFAFSEDKKRILDSGFTDYITKPIHKQALLEVLERINL